MVLELRHDILSAFVDISHLVQRFSISRRQVKEWQLVERLSLLIGQLNQLVIALSQCLFPQLLEALFVIQLLSCLIRQLQISRINRQLKFRLLVRSQTQSQSRVIFLEQITHQGISLLVVRFQYLLDLISIFLQQSFLQQVLLSINLNLFNWEIHLDSS